MMSFCITFNAHPHSGWFSVSRCLISFQKLVSVQLVKTTQTKTAPLCMIHRSAVITVAVQARFCSCICILYNYKRSIFLSYLKCARKEMWPFSLGHYHLKAVLLGVGALYAPATKRYHRYLLKQSACTNA